MYIDKIYSLSVWWVLELCLKDKRCCKLMSIEHLSHHFSKPIFVGNSLDVVSTADIPPRLLGHSFIFSLRGGSVPWNVLLVAVAPLQRTALGPLGLMGQQMQRVEGPRSWPLWSLMQSDSDCGVKEYECPASSPLSSLPWGLEYLWGVTYITVCQWEQAEVYPVVGLMPVVTSLLGFPIMLWRTSFISLPSPLGILLY